MSFEADVIDNCISHQSICLHSHAQQEGLDSTNNSVKISFESNSYIEAETSCATQQPGYECQERSLLSNSFAATKLGSRIVQQDGTAEQQHGTISQTNVKQSDKDENAVICQEVDQSQAFLLTTVVEPEARQMNRIENTTQNFTQLPRFKPDDSITHHTIGEDSSCTMCAYIHPEDSAHLSVPSADSDATTVPEAGLNSPALKDAFQSLIAERHSSARAWRQERASSFNDDDDFELGAIDPPSCSLLNIAACFPLRRDEGDDDRDDAAYPRRPRSCGLGLGGAAGGGRETFLGRAVRAVRESMRRGHRGAARAGP